ncbi:MAG: HAD family phosphatase [Nanoarchaeota archaeon]|nr:HAD family phosphatase [Nanoarchaeota archaeon]
MIKAIIFDIGGVLVKKIHGKLLEELISKYNLDKNELENFEPELFGELMIGKISEKEYFSKIIKKFNLPISESELHERAKELTQSIPETWEIVKKLKGKYVLAILSDMNKEWAKIREEKFRLSENFDYIVYSYEIGVQKPNTKIYKYLLNLMKIPANECTFIDDKQKNVDIAKELGMKVIVFENAEKLRAELADLGVKVQ